MNRRPRVPIASPIFWIDRCLGNNKFPNALAGRVDIVRYIDTYPARNDVPDQEWIPHIVGKGWVILTRDRAILKNSAEIDAIRSTGARYVGISSSLASAEEQAGCFLKHYRTIEGFLLSRASSTDAIILAVRMIGVSRWTPKGWYEIKAKR